MLILKAWDLPLRSRLLQDSFDGTEHRLSDILHRTAGPKDKQQRDHRSRPSASKRRGCPDANWLLRKWSFVAAPSATNCKMDYTAFRINRLVNKNVFLKLNYCKRMKNYSIRHEDWEQTYSRVSLKPFLPPVVVGMSSDLELEDSSRSFE